MIFTTVYSRELTRGLHDSHQVVALHQTNNFHFCWLINTSLLRQTMLILYNEAWLYPYEAAKPLLCRRSSFRVLERKKKKAPFSELGKVELLHAFRGRWINSTIIFNLPVLVPSKARAGMWWVFFFFVRIHTFHSVESKYSSLVSTCYVSYFRKPGLALQRD